ncbi:MAG: hypothetical protein JST85_20925 [Acidobacteria bacterium]|nr:hypothetical protein [Acidobacteriota bacterium]
MTPIEEIRNQVIEFESLKGQGRLSVEAARTFAARAAELVIEQYRADSTCLREAVQLICQVAIDENPEIARTGITALFPQLVERLNDSFDPAVCQLYDRLFVQVIEFCRRLPEGKALNEGLNGFGLLTEANLLSRKSAIRNPQSAIPQKVLLLSRVTIGADVAVTSAILAKLRQKFPQAEYVILGSRKLRELYGGDDKIRIREITYERGGSLIGRITSWLDVVRAVQEERRGFGRDEVWIMDPDSRLTQLGLLPLVENDHNYFFFESRSYQPTGESTSIGQLAAAWSGELIGDPKPAYPFVALPLDHQRFGQTVATQIRNPHSGSLATIRNLTAVSFGVGGNPTKRVSAEFEQQLVERLLTDSKLILDKGATTEERDQINRIVDLLRAQGKTVIELNEHTKADLPIVALQQADVVTWDGGIGAFAGLIAASDQYIGYDSAGQHIAAALGVPTLTMFVNSSNAVFAERWRPFGKGKIDLVNIAPNGEASVICAISMWRCVP